MEGCEFNGCGCDCGVETDTICFASVVEVPASEAVLSSVVRRIAVLTQAEYDALEVKDGSTMYVIVEDTGNAAEQGR